MEAWIGWPFERVYLLLVATAFVVVGLQVFLFHWRGAFRSISMYAPVIGAPVITLAGLVGAFTRTGWIGWGVFAVFAIGVLDGLYGTILHVKGIKERIGGFTLRNMTTGPPVLLPVAFAALALTGSLAVSWGAW
jgi:hypothetical protein